MWSIQLTLLVSTCAFHVTVAQLFPFSPLRHYIDQRYADSDGISTTSNPSSLERYRYDEDSPLSSSSQVPSINRAIVDEEKVTTVAVTPKPKYTPHRLVPEPNVDPNTHWIPNIGYNGPRLSSHNQPSSPTNSVSVKSKFHEPPLKINSASTTVVESIPSLSVTIPIGGVHRKESGLIDYLVPPKYPSVYENHITQNEVSSVPSAPIKLLTSATTSTTQKPKKPKRKRPYKEHIRGSEKNASSEKRVRNRFRPSRTRPTSTVKPTLNEPHASATSFFQTIDTKPQPSLPIHVSNIHSSEAIGLGASDGERVEFQLHGQSGPDSYKFGFDTGDVKNRHFRYEEKDNHGNVKGHYGYYDKTGKLQIINYHADENGFHASSQ
ncbi:uncharacterized protein isoform X1 [Rhodnius prolixus]|uniref:uncharacterized protein isoform X1 n=1 Tax=Rhodnius prolixus TaxID=13249 RepID=UPI003D18E5F3